MFNIPVAAKGCPNASSTIMTGFILLNNLIYGLYRCYRAHMSFITVAFFSVKALGGFNVAESIIHESSTAAMVTICCGTVHQLLFTEGHKLSSFNSMLTFQ